MNRSRAIRLALLSALLLSPAARGQKGSEPTMAPLQRVVDLKVGETASVELHDGSNATIRLLGIADQRDGLQDAIRRATATVVINGDEITLESGNYRLPVEAGGVQIDCVVTSAFYDNTDRDHWKLEKDARFRLWPAGSPWFEPGTFGLPLRQRLFASDTQAGNEPTFVDGGNRPTRQQIYYHAGFDFAGYEGKTEVIAATDGVVVSVAGNLLDPEAHPPARSRYDVIYIRDDRGWYYRYSHLKAIETRVRLGHRIAKGDKIGELGKEGFSGGYAHLHFDISIPMHSGDYGLVSAFPFLWQAFREQHDPHVIALARPHQIAFTGETVTLDGGRSWTRDGRASLEWQLSDDRTERGATATISYARPGTYSEILKVTDGQGNVGYDFAVVQIFDPEEGSRVPPTVNAVHHPTFGIEAGDPVFFAVRTFRLAPDEGEEVWEFGDGAPSVSTRSNAFGREEGFGTAHDPAGYAETVHRFREPGDYVVTVRRENRDGHRATARLHVRVEPRQAAGQVISAK